LLICFLLFWDFCPFSEDVSKPVPAEKCPKRGSWVFDLFFLISPLGPNLPAFNPFSKVLFFNADWFPLIVLLPPHKTRGICVERLVPFFSGTPVFRIQIWLSFLFLFPPGPFWVGFLKGPAVSPGDGALSYPSFVKFFLGLFPSFSTPFPLVWPLGLAFQHLAPSSVTISGFPGDTCNLVFWGRYFLPGPFSSDSFWQKHPLPFPLLLSLLLSARKVRFNSFVLGFVSGTSFYAFSSRFFVFPLLVFCFFLPPPDRRIFQSVQVFPPVVPLDFFSSPVFPTFSLLSGWFPCPLGPFHRQLGRAFFFPALNCRCANTNLRVGVVMNFFFSRSFGSNVTTQCLCSLKTGHLKRRLFRGPLPPRPPPFRFAMFPILLSGGHQPPHSSVGLVPRFSVGSAWLFPPLSKVERVPFYLRECYINLASFQLSTPFFVTS